MSEPVVRRKYQYTDLAHNNNKFWMIEYTPEGVLTTTWGRVGQAPQMAIKPSVTFPDVEKLIREKERKGYIEVELLAPDVTQNADASTLDPKTQQLLDLIFREANSSIRGYLAVDVHELSHAQIDKGRSLLEEIQRRNKRLMRKATREKIAELVEAYYNTIPTQLPARIDRETVIQHFIEHLSEYEERLDQVKAGLSISQAQAADRHATLLDTMGGVEINPMAESCTAYEQIADYVNRTSGGRNQIRDIFSVHIPHERSAWEDEKRGKHNVTSLFHGTRTWNVRHILTSGLIVPRIAANGRRFGHGVYFADWARRSLNYTGGRTSPLHMMFVADVALGTQKKLDGIGVDWQAAPPGYDSVWGVASYGGLDEFVIYRSSQQTIRALVTLE